MSVMMVGVNRLPPEVMYFTGRLILFFDFCVSCLYKERQAYTTWESHTTVVIALITQLHSPAYLTNYPLYEHVTVNTGNTIFSDHPI